MGTTLTGTTPQDTYDSLIKVTDNGPLSGTAKYLSDGLGNDSVLALSTGNIGIGTTSPSRNLHILGGAGIGTVLKLEAGSGAVTYLQLAYNGATNAQSGYISYDSSANMGLFTNDTERMRITSAGNVGIGTSSPSVKLDVESGIEGITAGFAGATYGVRIDNGGAFSTGASTIHGVNSTLTASYQPLRLNGSYTALCVSNTEVVRATANGLTFNGDTAAANALDDYEEGTWTMGVSFGGASTGVTYALNLGTYTKIGRQVTVNGYVELSSKGSSTGDAVITGLPFTIANTTANFSAVSLWLFNVTFANQFTALGVQNTTQISLREITEAGIQSNLTNADFANNSHVIVSLTYFV